ncbi:MAG: flagellar hook-length control protein FliK [Gammaproteobacteria bacterium]|nr:MAG: flagellar hook-length control protein FliK [Gammaproteobacteria bacterium]
MLQQWLAGGSPLPEGGPLAEAGGQTLPLAGLLKVLGGEGGEERPDAADKATGFSPAGPVPGRLAEAIGELLAGAGPDGGLDRLLPGGRERSEAFPPGLQPLLSSTVAGQSAQPTLEKSLLSMPVPQRVGEAGWGGAIGERLVWMVKGEMQRAELKLTPPNLGPLEIRLTVNDDKASVSFVSHHAAVRDAIEAALPRLREMLAQDALQLVRADVGGGQTGHGDGATGSAADGGGPSGDGMGSGAAERLSEDSAPAGRTSSSRGVGLLDLFA